jgi:hypothetical protein
MFDYALFARIADKCNLAATFAGVVEAGKGFTATGKVDFRAIPGMMESAYMYADAACTHKVTMVEILLAKAGIDPATFAWRGNSRTGKVPHEMSETFVGYAVSYLKGKYNHKYDFTGTVSAPAPKRKAIPADILAGMDI